ncbi:MAG TPA: hypothetical protein VFT29_14590 [Gemmatimonadaceae bacterium]|nr:hypothetical protein [Gemmatimonadaceae bacterium]
MRKFAYQEPDNESLRAAEEYGFTVVSMRRDWRTIFPARERVARRGRSAVPVRGAVFTLALGLASVAGGQNRGVYLPGIGGLHSGVQPPPGLSYAKLSSRYTASTFGGPNGESLPLNADYTVAASSRTRHATRALLAFGPMRSSPP